MISSDYKTHSEAIGRLSPQLGTWTEWEYCLSCSWGTSHRQLRHSSSKVEGQDHRNSFWAVLEGERLPTRMKCPS